MSRKTAREVAMKLAFARMFGGDETYEDVLEKSGIFEPVEAADVAFSDGVIDGIEANKATIDKYIADNAIGWSFDRLPRVDLCIMRVALYEMLYREDIPTGVSINEAVELAKRFGGEDSSAFINGLLGTVSRKLKG